MYLYRIELSCRQIGYLIKFYGTNIVGVIHTRRAISSRHVLHTARRVHFRMLRRYRTHRLPYNTVDADANAWRTFEVAMCC